MYYVVYGFFYLLSLLPFPLIYLLSDGISFVLYGVVKYRREVVRKNLLLAFPDKSNAERKTIERDFYTHFTDNWLEFIKLLSISRNELNKRFKGDYSVLNHICENGQSVQVHLGHYFNWEYANVAYAGNMNFPFLVAYKPLVNKVFNRIFYKVRARFGTHLLASDNFRNDFAPFARKKFVLVLVADQSEFPEKAFWAPFFGEMATFVKGPERTAILNNAAVTMATVEKVKRGYYRSRIELLTTEPRSLPPGEITKRMITFIEDAVRRQPANYLWSHRRWKWTFDPQKYTVG